MLDKEKWLSEASFQTVDKLHSADSFIHAVHKNTECQLMNGI